MDAWSIQITLIIIAVLFALGMYPVWRYIWKQRQEKRAPAARGARSESTIIEMDIHEDQEGYVAEAEQQRGAKAARQKRQRKRKPFRIPRPPLPSWRAMVVTMLVLLLVGGLGWLWYDWQMRAYANSFVVLVAPFETTGDPQTGEAVARELVRVLEEQSEGQLRVHQIDTAPTSDQEALALARQQTADVLVWGDVEQGGLLNDTSLEPRLTYAPSGTYGPDAWIGYQGRFVVDGTYALADEPVNGQVILPPLLLALADYSAGRADIAMVELDSLLADYTLDTTLPSVLRGNVLWARGRYEQAAEAYRRAMGQAEEQRAWLANNLGAVLLDAQDVNSRDVLNEAARLLGEDDLAALRFNLGLLAVQEGNPTEALDQFEQARRIAGAEASTWLLLAQTRAYREIGQLEAAAETLAAAEQRIQQDIARAPAEWQWLSNGYLRSDLQEQRGLLELAQLVNARGPLAWELEVDQPEANRELQDIHDQLQSAVDTSSNMVQRSQQHAIAESVSYDFIEQAPDGTETILVADGQATRAEQLHAAHEYHLAMVLTEVGQASGNWQQGFVASLWSVFSGGGNPLREAETILARQVAAFPGDIDRKLAYARVLRVQEAADLNEVEALYNEVIEMDPTRPEGYYGNGMVAWQGGDRAQAEQWLDQALEQEPRYYPARLKLIYFAEQERDWQTALAHLHTLHEQYPLPETTLRLASILRQSGEAGYAEAEQVLLPLTEPEQPQGVRVEAMIELGRLYRDNQQLEEAIAEFTRARSIDDGSATAAFELGMTLVQQEQYEQAAEQFQATIDRSQGSMRIQAQLQLADLYAGPLQDAAAASRIYEEVIASEEQYQDYSTMVLVGDQLLREQQIQPALDAYQRAISLEPQRANNDAHLQAQLSAVYLARNNELEARQRAQAAVDLSATIEDADLRAEALVSLADVERTAGNMPQAVELYNQALVVNPNYVPAAIGLGQVAVGQDNWSVARGHFQQALEFANGQDDPLAHFWYAEALLRQGNFQEARDHFQQALDLRPAFPEAYLGIAQATYLQGNPDEALQVIETTTRDYPDYGEGWLFQGKLLQERRQNDQALDAFNRAIEANGRLAEAYYRRALIAMERENYSQASDDLRRAVDLQPTNIEAYFRLGQASQALGDASRAADSFEYVIATSADTELVDKARLELQQIQQ